MDRPRWQVSLRDRVRYLFDRTLARSTGTLLGWLAVCCLVVVVPVSALLVWTDPAAPRTVAGRLMAVWRTSAEALRLGGVAGAPLRMLLSVALGLITLLCVSTVVGVVTTGLGDRLVELRRGRSMVVERDHMVVLGWSDQVVTVVGELLAARTGVVTLLADRDPAEMESVLQAALGRAVGVRLVCRSGAPSDPEALRLVSAGAAAAVVVLPAGGGEGDVAVVRVLLALRALLGPDPGPPVVAAVRDGRHLPAARLAAGPRGTVLETDWTTARLLVQSARRPGLSRALRDLLDFSGAEFHVFAVPEMVGLTFEEAALRYDASCAVGLLRADGSALLTPPPRTVVAAGDRLVAVAHEDTVGPPTDFGGHVDPSVMAPVRELPETASRVLMLGWNRRAPLIVDMLRRSARPGCALDVVTWSDLPSPPPLGPLSPPVPPLHVAHHVRDIGDPETLGDLDVFAYDSVIVLGADHGTGPEQPDDRTLLALLMLKARQEKAARTLPVLAEMRDSRSRAVAPLGPASDTVVRGELTALLMAQIAHHPDLATVFEDIFATRGGALALRPAHHYVLPGREASFATIVRAALHRGECAIGYRTRPPTAAHPHDGVHLCPDKGMRRAWNTPDEVLVLTAGGTGLAVSDLARPALPGMRTDHQDGDSPTSVTRG
ncbi:NAD-binding lipoprotein [Streptomyces sp. NPDC005574]|uniref:CASTOR/POLLUX-related putative ion channel n=1 Tax=Streptomyces sp. NPDC005574 TaxID=3156891 RepID=UPI0033A2C61A